MLRVGLTGGIAAGKSTVARRLVEHGAVLIDADVWPGRPSPQARTGWRPLWRCSVLACSLRTGRWTVRCWPASCSPTRWPAERLNAIVHPRVRRRSAQLLDRAPADAVVVQDIPLLVETGLAPSFHLVIVVHASPAERIRRLAESRGMAEHEARARIGAQADDEARRSAADVWLSNEDAVPGLQAAVDRLWSDRLVPFEANVRHGHPVAEGPPRLVGPDPTWPRQAARLAARVARAAGVPDGRVWHVGSTAVPGLAARDVVDLVLAAGPTAAPGAALAQAGFPVVDGRLHAGADPGRPARLEVHPPGSPRAAARAAAPGLVARGPRGPGCLPGCKARLAAAHGGEQDALGTPAPSGRGWTPGGRRWSNWAIASAMGARVGRRKCEPRRGTVAQSRPLASNGTFVGEAPPPDRRARVVRTAPPAVRSSTAAWNATSRRSSASSTRSR